MKHILFIAIFSALIGLVACGDKQVVTDVLNRAETLMDEHPDSSLVMPALARAFFRMSSLDVPAV